MILTRIPVHWPDADISPNTARSYWAFPLIGIGVAAIPAILGASLLSLGVPPLASAALMLMGIILMTGGLHHDGLADLGDSLGGRDPDHRLKIMHDSAIGSFGTLALVLVVIAAIACLAQIGEKNPAVMAQAMLGVAAMSRGMMALQRWSHTTPTAGGLADVTGTPDRHVMMISLLLALLAGVIFLPPVLAVLAMGVGAIVTYALGRFLKQWIGGVNGDGLGATQQLSQMAMLMLLSALL